MGQYGFRVLIFHQHRCTIGLACAQAVAIRGAPHVARRHAAVPRALQLRVLSTIGIATTFMSVSELKAL